MTEKKSDDRESGSLQPKPTYEVGYCRPPKKNQFQKGQSGNPKGRPRGNRNLWSQAVKVLTKPVGMTVDGKRQRIPALIALENVVLNRGLKDSQRAAEFMFRLAKDLRLYDQTETYDLSSQGLTDDFLARLSPETLRELLRVGKERGAEKQNSKKRN
jgi:hypothetical protein